MTDENYLQPKSKTYLFLSYWITTILSRMIFFVWGFYSIKIKEFNITDIWTDYQPIQNTEVGPIIVSNHTSYFDMWVYLMIRENPAFLSKSSVAKIPVVGFFAKMHQTVFLNRADS